MTNPSFEQMTKSELKAYLREHPNDQMAFHTLMDKINAEPNQVWYKPDNPTGDEELRKAIARKRQSKGDAA